MNKSNVVIFYNYSEFQKPTYLGCDGYKQKKTENE